jgi:hypothetical protein
MVLLSMVQRDLATSVSRDVRRDRIAAGARVKTQSLGPLPDPERKFHEAPEMSASRQTGHGHALFRADDRSGLIRGLRVGDRQIEHRFGSSLWPRHFTFRSYLFPALVQCNGRHPI